MLRVDAPLAAPCACGVPAILKLLQDVLHGAPSSGWAGTIVVLRLQTKRNPATLQTIGSNKIAN
jgi:hypothetical protein